METKLEETGETTYSENCEYNNWRASKVSGTLSGVYKFVICDMYVSVCVHIWTYMNHNSSTDTKLMKLMIV